VLDMVVPAIGYWWCRPPVSYEKFAWEDVRWLLRFGAPIWLAGFLSNVFVLDNFLVGTLCGVEAVGLYALAFTLARLPVQVIAHAVTKGAFPAYSVHQGDPLKAGRLFTLAYTAVVWGLVPLAVLAALLAPEVVQLTVGAKWVPMIPAFRWLCVFTVLRGVQDLTVDFFVSQGKAVWFRNVLALEAVALLLVGPLAAWRGGPVGMAIAVDVMLCVGVPYLVGHLRQLVSLKYRTVWVLPLMASVTATVVIGIAASWLQTWPMAWRLVIELLIGLAAVLGVWGTFGRAQWRQVQTGIRNLWEGRGTLA